MADPSDREAKQPYHAVERLPIGQAAERLTAYATTAELMARQAVQRIVDQLSQGGYRGIGLGILDSAGAREVRSATSWRHMLLSTRRMATISETRLPKQRRDAACRPSV